MVEVAVLVPGIMGSELRLGKELVWPGPVESLFLPYNKMEALLDKNLKATDVIRNYTIFSTQYDALIEDLEQCGFHEHAERPTLVIFPYDWRQKNEDSAVKLAECLSKSFDQHEGKAEFSLIAHSMGGLVARFYLESGKYNAHAAFGTVRRLITMGTPHRGSPLALARILGQEKVLWLSPQQVAEFAKNDQYPSAYQLLPPSDEPFAWDESPKAGFMDCNIYEKSVASSLSLNEKNLDAAQALHRVLNGSKRPVHVRYFCFAGTCQATATLIRIKKDGATTKARKQEMESSGDGTVPFWSSTLRGIQNMPVGGEHGTIYKDRILRRTLGTLMGRDGLLGPLDGIGVADVSVREQVSEPGSPMHVVMGFGGSLQQASGELRVIALTDKDGNPLAEDRLFEKHLIEYSGPAVETLSVVFKAPPLKGAYRVSYYSGSDEKPQGKDEFFVQEKSQ